MKKKVHSLIDKVYSQKNLAFAWEKVKKNRGCAGIDKVTIVQFEERKDHYLEVLTRRKAPLRLQEVIDRINPVIRGWGKYYRKAHVRGLFNRLDRWIERRLYSFLAKRWRNTMWRRYPTRRLIEEFGLVRLTHLIPGLVIR